MDFDEDSLLLLLAACILRHVPEIIHQLLLLLLLSCVLIHEIQYSLQLADTVGAKKTLSANWSVRLLESFPISVLISRIIYFSISKRVICNWVD